MVVTDRHLLGLGVITTMNVPVHVDCNSDVHDDNRSRVTAEHGSITFETRASCGHRTLPCYVLQPLLREAVHTVYLFIFISHAHLEQIFRSVL